MRARYIIRDMANGSHRAWRQAEWKLRKGESHARVVKDLEDALASLPDPRKKHDRKPPDGHRYAVDVHIGEDWGEGPIVETDYKFESRTDADHFALQEMWRQYCLGTPRDRIGAYVFSDDAENGGDPSVHELLALPS
jgi:hypothetical protein